MESFRDTYTQDAVVQNIGVYLGAAGTSTEFIIGIDFADEIVDAWLILDEAVAPERAELIVQEGLEALGLPTVPIDPGDIQHNDLGGLQGGTTDEYYHLTAAEYATIGGSSAWDFDEGSSSTTYGVGTIDFEEGDST